jgi:hypothetical protein
MFQWTNQRKAMLLTSRLPQWVMFYLPWFKPTSVIIRKSKRSAENGMRKTCA